VLPQSNKVAGSLKIVQDGQQMKLFPLLLVPGLFLASSHLSKAATATACSAFLGSLGVNTHVDQGYNPNAYIAPLQYLGVRNIDNVGLQFLTIPAGAGTLMPAATYIHNLTSILADDQGLTVPGALGYSIANQPATVHDLLLQKADGTFELVVWGEQASGSNAIAVNLGATYDTVNIYDVTSGTTPIQVLNNVSSVLRRPGRLATRLRA
jgi:hypothetical protein